MYACIELSQDWEEVLERRIFQKGHSQFWTKPELSQEGLRFFFTKHLEEEYELQSSGPSPHINYYTFGSGPRTKTKPTMALFRDSKRKNRRRRWGRRSNRVMAFKIQLWQVSHVTLCITGTIFNISTTISTIPMNLRIQIPKKVSTFLTKEKHKLHIYYIVLDDICFDIIYTLFKHAL